MREVLIFSVVIALFLFLWPPSVGHAYADDVAFDLRGAQSLDDLQTTQQSAPPRAIANFWLADRTQTQRMAYGFMPPLAAAALAPALADTTSTITAVTPATPETLPSYLLTLLAGALGTLALIFVPRLFKALGMTASPELTDAMLKIVDNALDWGAKEAATKFDVSTHPIDFHNTLLDEAEDFILKFASPAQLKSLGLTADNLNAWLKAELAPAT